MSKVILDVAALGLGHETKKYHSADKDSLEEMIEYVQDKLKKGFQMHGSANGDDYVKIITKNKNASMEEIKKELKKNDRIMLKEEVKELVLLPPVHGG